MKIIDWIKHKLGIGKDKVSSIEAPKVEESVQSSSDLQDRVKNCNWSMQEERDRQIRLAKEFMGADYNLSSEEMQQAIIGKVKAYIRQEVSPALSDIDAEALKQIHNIARSNPELREYLQGIDITTQDDRILSLVNQMKQEAEEVATNNGYTQESAKRFLPKVMDTMEELKEKEAKAREELQPDEELTK